MAHPRLYVQHRDQGAHHNTGMGTAAQPQGGGHSDELVAILCHTLHIDQPEQNHKAV